MRAQVDQKFSHGFALTEEGLVKIGDILKNRLSSADGTPVTLAIDVKRSDHALITYDSLDDVLKEENGKIDRIQSVKIYNKVPGDEFSVEFEKGERTRLRIASDSRDNALLALSDLREYLKNEIVVHKLGFVYGLISNRLSFPIAMLISFVTMMFQFSSVIERATTPPPVNPNTEQKIGYLFQSTIDAHKALPAETFFVFVFAWPLGVIGGLVILLLVWPYLYETDIFVWGKEKARIESNRSTLSKVFWTILIGLVVSVAAGAFIEYLK